MGTTWSQFFPPHPTLTESNLPSQEGRVFVVTGGYSGVGLELCTILYGAGGKVYLAGRSEWKAVEAIAGIKSLQPSSRGDICFLPVNLDDLTSIKAAVETITFNESRLDVLFNNAGVSNPPRGSLSPQGHELQFATNCLGPHLLTKLLLPLLKHTAQNEPPATVRIIWTASVTVDLSTPKEGVNLDELLRPDTDPQRNYENTKVGNWFLAHAFADEIGSHGILSVAVNPGNLKSALTRHLSPWVPWFVSPLLYPARMGAYTELWAGLSGELTISDGGKYVLPWGRLHPNPRQDLLLAMRTRAEGGTGAAATFVQYCDDQISGYL
ncbi:steroid dehydrogenase [Penicillium canariense]|uniref:Steroid dehydrogenase n=1 Tax=Penicillium canariense TaxID=189055 RepID=A0A9W9HK96_9EURO|nr:steroid dehydrogenase [Penicillium canariense]KAJ5151443.1 steroid dehydrogenase [Penicillium canariense]